jgi:hypothetical protein
LSRIDAVASFDDQLAGLEEQLGTAVGDASLCTVSRAAGGAVPGVKHREGGVTALREVRRMVGAGVAELERALAGWRDELRRARERRMGRDWLSYRAGGVDALEDALRQSAPSTEATAAG